MLKKLHLSSLKSYNLLLIGVLSQMAQVASTGDNSTNHTRKLKYTCNCQPSYIHPGQAEEQGLHDLMQTQPAQEQRLASHGTMASMLFYVVFSPFHHLARTCTPPGARYEWPRVQRPAHCYVQVLHIALPRRTKSGEHDSNPCPC